MLKKIELVIVLSVFEVSAWELFYYLELIKLRNSLKEKY